MKLTKNLLQAVAVGLVVSTMGACSLVDDLGEITPGTCEEGKDKTDEGDDFFCPACGMG